MHPRKSSNFTILKLKGRLQSGQRGKEVSSNNRLLRANTGYLARERQRGKKIVLLGIETPPNHQTEKKEKKRRVLRARYEKKGAEGASS